MGTRKFHILVGVDFSPCSTRAVKHAAQLALRLDAMVDLVHVFPFTTTVSMAELVLVHDALGRFSDAKKQLMDMREAELPAGLPVHIHLRLGDPVRGLLDAIEQLQPDMVVLGTHGRGAVMRALMGSVSERLVRRSPVPVMVVPAEHETAPAVAETPARAYGPMGVAWSCRKCGHIRAEYEPTDRCSRCGASPAQWDTAPVLAGPADAGGPAVAEGVLPQEEQSAPKTPDPPSLFPVAEPGKENTNVNPELRVRY